MRKQVIILVFSVLAAFGLICGLLYCVDQDLNSDSVVPGLVAMELFKHGNIQFTYPADDPYLFTDIIPFYLVTQFLSGYSPVVLKLTAFAIYLLVVAVFSYIVYRYAGTINALIFAALFANLSPLAYYVFITPEYHVGTLLAAGVMILILDFYLVRRISIYRMLAYAVFVALIVLSDSLIIATFLIPYAACYLLFYRNKLKRSVTKIKSEKSTSKGAEAWNSHDIRNIDIMMILLVIVPGMAWLLKTFEPESLYQYTGFIPHSTGFVSFGQAFLVNIPRYFQDLAFIVSQGLHSILTLQFSLWDIVAATVFLAVLIYAVTRRNAHAEYLYTMFILSGVVMFLGFVFLDRATDLWAPRFINFTAVSIFIAIALAFNENSIDKFKNISLNTLFLAVVIILLITTIPANLLKVASLDYQPNKAEYELINYLDTNNISQAYSDYWHANILTYLTNEALEIRSIEVTKDQHRIVLYTWLGSSRWYKTIYANPIVIANKNDEFNNEMQAFINQYPDNLPKKITYYKDYVIYSLFILG
jgi:hypothetical protein